MSGNEISGGLGMSGLGTRVEVDEGIQGTKIHHAMCTLMVFSFVEVCSLKSVN